MYQSVSFSPLRLAEKCAWAALAAPWLRSGLVTACETVRCMQLGALAGCDCLPTWTYTSLHDRADAQHHQRHVPEPGRRLVDGLVLRQPAQLRAPPLPGQRPDCHAGLGHVQRAPT